MKLHPIEFKLLNFLNDVAQAHQNSGQKALLLLMVSGGKDSMALLNAVAAVQNNLPKPLDWAHLQLKVLHFNHQQRATESDADAQFVESEAAVRKIDYASFLWNDWQHPDKDTENFQAMARLWRRSTATDVVKQHAASGQVVYIVTAHHLDDLCEGMLMNLVRGTGIDGLRGFAPVDGYFLKPFAHTSLSDLKSYIADSKISYRDDSSNASLDYRRNVMRLQILPQLEALNPAIREALFGLSQSARAAMQKINLNAKEIQQPSCSNNVTIELSAASTPASVLFDIKQGHAQLAKILTVKSIKNLLHHFHLALMQSWKQPDFDWDTPATVKKIPIGHGWMAQVCTRRLVFSLHDADNL